MAAIPGKGMIGKVLAGGLGLLLLALLAFWYRPWAEYSPARMNSLFREDLRVENFRHLDRIFPYKTLRKAARVSEFPREEKPLALDYPFKGETRNLDEFLVRVNATGLLVLKDGKIVHERYLRGADQSSRLTSWSMAKSVVSTLIGLAKAQGKIRSLQDKVSVYVPELAGSAYGDARIVDLLQMSSGVRFAEVYADKASDINVLFYKVFLAGQSINQAVANRPFEREPGTKFHYISSDTQVLTWVLAKAVGKSLAEFAQEQLWDPLGMESDAWWSTDFHGAELGYCCLNAVLRDYGRFGQLYLQQGVWGGKALLPEGWVREATRPSRPSLQPGSNGTGDALRGYQYQFWVPLDHDREFFAAGIWGQYIWVSEKDNVVIVRTSVDPVWNRNLAETIVVNREIAKAVSAAK